MQNQFIPPETSPDYVSGDVSSVSSLEAETAHTAGTQAVTAQTMASERAVTKLLAQAQRTIHRRKLWFYTSGAVYIGLNLAGLIPGLNEWFGAHRFMWVLGPLLMLVVGGFYLAMLFGPMKFNADELLHVGGKSAIPTLLDYLMRNTSPSHREACIRALAILLPQLQATDTLLLTPRHRRYLHTLLNPKIAGNERWRGGEELIVALLKAYEQVGNAEDIPAVERLASNKPLSGRQLRIQAAAQACLPLLQAHVSGMQSEQTLLRASRLDTNTPAVLLRPATSVSSMPNTELLRATPSDAVPPSD